MGQKLLLAVWRYLVPLPGAVWKYETARNGRQAAANLSFMSEDHHRVRDYLVREIPRVGKPLSPEFIAQELTLPLDRVQNLLVEMEKRLTFLFRNKAGDVTWAYPITADNTPHYVTFSSGEQINAA